MPNPPVELHVVSDATGETAARLVQALEAQFPEQEFVEIRHPRVESEEDLQLAVNRMLRPRSAVVVYTLVQPELREWMRTLCRRARPPLLRPARPADRSRRAGLRPGVAKMTPGSRPPLNSAYFKRMEAIEFAVRFDDGVAQGLPRSRCRPCRRFPHLEDAALDLPRRPRPQGGERPRREGDRAPQGLFSIDQLKVVGVTIDPNRLAEIRGARVRDDGRRRGGTAATRSSPRCTRSSNRRRSSTAGSKCPVIDISGCSIEETAHRLLRVVEERKADGTRS